MQHAFKPRITADQYLQMEQASDVRHEFVDGELYAMAGASEAHNLIALNVASRLRHAVRGGPCRVFMSDMKMRVAQWNAFYYPDVMVVCDSSDAQTHAKERPTIVIEVMSASTESIDRREKLLAYRTLDSLQTYVLIAQDRRHVEVYRRGADGVLVMHETSAQDVLQLDPIGTLTLDDVYEDVELPPPAPQIHIHPAPDATDTPRVQR